MCKVMKLFSLPVCKPRYVDAIEDQVAMLTQDLFKIIHDGTKHITGQLNHLTVMYST